MSDQSHNTLSRLATQVQQLKTAETMLLTGCTRHELAEALGVSVKQAERIRDLFTALGHPVSSSWTPGSSEPAVFTLAKKDRMFR